MAPSPTTRKLLALRSRDKCAFPNCHHTLQDYVTNTITGEYCHIKGEKTKSKRHDKYQTTDQRDSIDNLIFLCCIHHKIIDNRDDIYTVDRLLDMKKNHEEKIDDIPEATITNETGWIKARLTKMFGRGI